MKAKAKPYLNYYINDGFRLYARMPKEISEIVLFRAILLTFNKLTSSAANGKELMGKIILHQES